jgi:hypothetical protein
LRIGRWWGSEGCAGAWRGEGRGERVVMVLRVGRGFLRVGEGWF